MTSSSPASTTLTGDQPSQTSVPYLMAIGRVQRLPRFMQFSIFAGIFFGVAAFDLVVDKDLSLFALYLIPTLYAAWFLGQRWSYLSCLASAVVWVIDDWGLSTVLHHMLIPYWNIGGRVLVLVAIVAILNALKSSLDLEHATARRAVQRELEIASEVQNRLLPLEGPGYPGLDFSFFYQPAREVGGDYFDFIPFDSQRMGLAIGDVSGKGLPGALLMASLQSLVRTNLAVREGDVGQFASDVNSAFYKLTSSSRYATLFFACVDASSRTVLYVNAGHNPPLVFRSGALTGPELLESGGRPVGLTPGCNYHAGQVLLGEGDVLVAFTDGVTEAVNPQNEEFGENRISAIVSQLQGSSAAAISNQIALELRQFMADSSQWDDITLVVMKVTKPLED